MGDLLQVRLFAEIHRLWRRRSLLNSLQIIFLTPRPSLSASLSSWELWITLKGNMAQSLLFLSVASTSTEGIQLQLSEEGNVPKEHFVSYTLWTLNTTAAGSTDGIQGDHPMEDQVLVPFKSVIKSFPREELVAPAKISPSGFIIGLANKW